MSDRLPKIAGYGVIVRNWIVAGFFLIAGIMVSSIVIPGLAQKALAAPACPAGTKTSPFNTGTCVGSIQERSGPSITITDYIDIAVDVTWANGVTPTTVNIGVNNSIPDGQNFTFNANASKSNEYVSIPVTGDGAGGANPSPNGAPMGYAISTVSGGCTPNQRSITISATNAASQETIKSDPIDYCAIHTKVTTTGAYSYTVTLKNFTKNSTGTGQTCQAGGLGWLICPVVDFLLGAMQTLQDWFITPYLSVPPLKLNDPNDAIFKLWDTMRNLANVLLVLMFFLVIFSQATSVGINRYGLKRMLPRLLTAAILANLSYYLLTFIIDTFNLFGAGVSQLIATVVQSGGGGTQGNGQWSLFILVPLGIAAVVFAGGTVIPWLLNLIATAFLILLAAIAVLVIRQMIIIVIVIISPIMFVVRAIEDA